MALVILHKKKNNIPLLINTNMIVCGMNIDKGTEIVIKATGEHIYVNESIEKIYKLEKESVK